MPALHFLKKVVDVPDTWEGWAMRVLTIAVVIMLLVSLTLISMVRGLSAYVSDSRQQRIQFQVEETARQCVILASQGISEAQLKALKC